MIMRSWSELLRPGRNSGLLVIGIVLATLAKAQGPASCGFHLDVFTADTSTHSAIADMPAAVGSFAGIPAFAPGNPYTGWLPPGTAFSLVLTVPGGALGPAPFGAGSPVTILWSVGGALVPIPPGPPIIAPCAPGPLIIGVLPIGGAL